MGFLDFFKSKAESEREKRLAERRAAHTVERHIDNLDDKLKDYEKERDSIWNQARQKLQSGQKAEAARLLTTYKSKMVLINRVERQKQFAQNKLDQISASKDTSEMVSVLSDLAQRSDVSPEEIEISMDQIEFATDQIMDSNKIMERAIDKDLERLNREVENEMNMDDDDDLMKALEAEIAGDQLKEAELKQALTVSEPPKIHTEQKNNNTNLSSN